MTTSNSVATNLRSKRLVPTDATQVNYDSEIARNSVTVYTWNENGKILAKAFLGRKSKPYWFYCFSSEENRQARIDDLISGKMKSTEQDLAFRNKLKAKVSNIQVGDVLCASWGWEQTNIDFYQVLELVGKSTVVFREIAADKTYDSSMSGKCTPILNEFVGETMRKRVGDYGIKINSCSSASKWEGQPKYWSSYA
tara:strand:+ start:4767 stop:5354 length:588 start_codon:yes stop_codon:yes gene_type:complete